MAKVKSEMIYDSLEKYAEWNKNVLLVGGAGVGKTTMVRMVAEELGLKLKYYSAATLDPWADLVGIPVPTENREELKFVKPEDISSAEIIFFDELNRAHAKVQDAVLEIIQYHSINGDPLPNLKMCWAAINPPNDGYNVTDMDAALRDRFHIQIQVPACISTKYLINQGYDKDIVDKAYTWYKDRLNDEMKEVITPRRLEYIIDIAQKDPELIDDVLPWTANNIPTVYLKQALAGETVGKIDRNDLRNDPDKYIKMLKDEEQRQKIAALIVKDLSGGKIWTTTLLDLHKILLELPNEQFTRLATKVNLKERLQNDAKKYGNYDGFQEILNKARQLGLS
jgi:MoxR-like ATPase